MQAQAALSLGMIFVGALEEDALSAIIETIMYMEDSQKDQTVARYLAVALGLLCMGVQENCEPTLDAIRTMEHPLTKYADIFIQGCAYLGTGNVIKSTLIFYVMKSLGNDALMSGS
jgi:26S proteasome regulatory subunit N1